MRTKTLPGVIGALLAVGAACGDGTGTLSLASYSVDMQGVETEFLADSLDHGAPEGEDYPIDDELVYFTHAFESLEKRVEGWKALSPPPDLATEHQLLVFTMEEVQRIVLEYAQQAALGGDDFAMAEMAVDAEVVASSAAWRAACRDLAERAILLEAPIAFAGSCAVPTLTE